MSTMFHHRSPISPQPPMLFTVPEAAWVADIDQCAIRNDVKKKVVSGTEKSTVLLDWYTVSYFRSVREVHNDLTVELRKRLYLAIRDALKNNADAESISLGNFKLCLSSVVEQICQKARDLREARELVGHKPGVRGNNYVIRGTRIPARMLAEIHRSGASIVEIGQEYSLTERQVELAVLFDQLHPQVGRPTTKHNSEWSDLGAVDRLDIEDLGELRRS